MSRTALASSAPPLVRVGETQNQRQTLTAVAKIWDRFKEATLNRVVALEQAVMALLEGTLSDEWRRQAEREAHKLAGSVGTFGFAEGSRLARTMEQMLQAEAALGRAETLRLSELIVLLRQELERPSTVQSECESLPETTRLLLLVIDSDTILAEQLVTEGTAAGLRVTTAANVPTAREALKREQPHVVLLDPSLPDAAEEGLALLAELTGCIPSVPVLILTAKDTFLDRVEVARLGGRRFLQKPLPPARVLEEVIQVLKETRAITAKIMAVDDDPQILATLCALLEPKNVHLVTLEDPRRFWDILEESSPDLLILDVDMPDLSGTELCRVARNDPRWNELPVVFLTARTDADTVHRVFAAGADDFVSKPIVGPELTARIVNRIERNQLLRSVAETDSLTGLANRRKSTEVLNQFFRLAAHQKQPLSLAVVDLDRFKQINDRYGHLCGDEVLHYLGGLLQQSFRREDVVARWGGEEFIVGMYTMTREEAVQRLTRVLRTLRAHEFRAVDSSLFHVTFSAGIAEYPADGTDIQTLYRAADQALFRAKEEGRDRVLPVGWQSAQTRTVQNADVVVVDDDDALAGLLLHSLETRGYRTHWLKDGQAAVEALAGQHPACKAQAVLLDVDLPGLDGFSVLRRLAQDGLLQDTRVIMLTVRTTEAEELKALELGAFDYVAKPFSPPVLMQRIRRALRS